MKLVLDYHTGMENCDPETTEPPNPPIRDWNLERKICSNSSQVTISVCENLVSRGMYTQGET